MVEVAVKPTWLLVKLIINLEFTFHERSVGGKELLDSTVFYFFI